MSNIPLARQLIAKGRRLISKGLALMTRAPHIRKTRVKMRRMTAELAEDIRDYERKHPDLSEHEIAHHFNVNAGRVSEALNGKH